MFDLLGKLERRGSGAQWIWGMNGKRGGSAKGDSLIRF